MEVLIGNSYYKWGIFQRALFYHRRVRVYGKTEVTLLSISHEIHPIVSQSPLRLPIGRGHPAKDVCSLSESVKVNPFWFTMLFESFPSKQLSKTSDVVKSSIWGRPSMEFAIHIYPHDIHWQTNIVMTFYHSIAFGKPPISAWASGVGRMELQPRKPRVVV